MYLHLETLSNLENKRGISYGQAGESFTDFVFAMQMLTDYFITSFCPKNDNENFQTKNGNPDNSGIQITPALQCEHYQCCPFACQNIVGPS